MSYLQSVLQHAFHSKAINALSIDRILSLEGLGGLRIFESINMIEEIEPIQQRKTFKERWFSFPWVPWRANRIIKQYRPSQHIFLVDGMLIMHPVMAQTLRKAIAQRMLTEMEQRQLNREANEGRDGKVNR